MDEFRITLFHHIIFYCSCNNLENMKKRLLHYNNYIKNCQYFGCSNSVVYLKEWAML